MKRTFLKSTAFLIGILGCVAIVFASVVPVILHNNFNSGIGGEVDMTSQDYTSWGMNPGHLEVDTKINYQFSSVTNSEDVLTGSEPITTKMTDVTYDKSYQFTKAQYQPDGTFRYRNEVTVEPTTETDKQNSAKSVNSFNTAGFTLWERATNLEPWNVVLVNLKRFWSDFYVPQLYSTFLAEYLLKNEYAQAATAMTDIQNFMGVDAETANSIFNDATYGFTSRLTANTWMLAADSDPAAIQKLTSHFEEKLNIGSEQILAFLGPAGTIAKSVEAALKAVNSQLLCNQVPCTPEEFAIAQWSTGKVLSSNIGGVPTYKNFADFIPTSPCEFDWNAYVVDKKFTPPAGAIFWLPLFARYGGLGPLLFTEDTFKTMYFGSATDISNIYGAEILSAQDQALVKTWVTEYFPTECLGSGKSVTPAIQEQNTFSHLAAKYSEEVLSQFSNMDIGAIINSVGMTGYLEINSKIISCEIIYQNDVGLTPAESTKVCANHSANPTIQMGAWNLISAAGNPNYVVNGSFNALKTASGLTVAQIQKMFVPGSKFMTALSAVQAAFKTEYGCSTAVCSNSELGFLQWKTSQVTFNWPASIKPSTYKPTNSLANLVPSAFLHGPIEYAAVMAELYPSTDPKTYALISTAIPTALVNLTNQFQIRRLLNSNDPTFASTNFASSNKEYILSYLKKIVEARFLSGLNLKATINDLINGYTDKAIYDVQSIPLADGGVDDLNHFVSYGGFVPKERVNALGDSAMFSGIKHTDKVRKYAQYLGYNSITVPILSYNNTEVIAVNNLWGGEELDGTDGWQFEPKLSSDDSLEQFFTEFYRILNWKPVDTGISFGDVEVNKYVMDSDDWAINKKYGVTEAGYLPLKEITQRNEMVTNGDSYIYVQPLFGRTVKKQEQFTYYLEINPNIFHPSIKPNTKVEFLTRTEGYELKTSKSNDLFESYTTLKHRVLVTRLTGFIIGGALILASVILAIGLHKRWWGKDRTGESVMDDYNQIIYGADA